MRIFPELTIIINIYLETNLYYNFKKKFKKTPLRKKDVTL